MSHTQRQRASHTRCARRSLVELTAAASRAVDDGLFVLSSGIAASNPRSEHTGEKTASLQAGLDRAKDLVQTRVGGEAVWKDIGGSSLEINFSAVLKVAATQFRADAVELNVQKEAADSPGQPQ